MTRGNDKTRLSGIYRKTHRAAFAFLVTNLGSEIAAKALLRSPSLKLHHVDFRDVSSLMSRDRLCSDGHTEFQLHTYPNYKLPVSNSCRHCRKQERVTKHRPEDGRAQALMVCPQAEHVDGQHRSAAL
jgi:hypothetical protein